MTFRVAAVVRAVSGARNEWGVAWPLPLVPLVYAGVLALLGVHVRPELWLVGGVILAVGFAGSRSASFLRDAFPYVAVLVGYDAVRYARAAWLEPDDVIGCGMRDVELRFFSAAPNVTLQEWCFAHRSAVLDVFLSVPYAIFAYFALGYATYLYFKDRPRMRRYLWAFALANFASFAMWLFVPVAPPWYVRAHGCGIDLAALPSPAGLGRVDALLGIHYFNSFYSRASSVFGAMPSMHCAYPMLGLCTAWRHIGWRTRPFHLFYVAWMAVAAVYFEHHWTLDVLAGWLVAVVATAVAGWLLDARPAGRATRVPEHLLEVH